MREFLDIINEAAVATGEKIDRSAFIYLPPKSPANEFAQCATCIHFMPDDERCSIFAASDHVEAEASCGLYVHGEPSNDQTCRSIVTPKEAGYVKGAVRCENCSWHEGSECGLFKTLMQKLPDVFNLETDVDPQGCCNAWQKR